MSSIDPNAVYTLGSSQGETSRLLRQADELLAANSALIDRVPLRPGDSAIDLGCGPVRIFDLLADRVGAGGPGGRAGRRPSTCRDGYRTGRKPPARNVNVLLGDARYTRLDATLLINVPRPGDVVAEMVWLTKPGGWVLSFEPDCEVWGDRPKLPQGHSYGCGLARTTTANRAARPGEQSARDST